MEQILQPTFTPLRNIKIFCFLPRCDIAAGNLQRITLEQNCNFRQLGKSDFSSCDNLNKVHRLDFVKKSSIIDRNIGPNFFGSLGNTWWLMPWCDVDLQEGSYNNLEKGGKLWKFVKIPQHGEVLWHLLPSSVTGRCQMNIFYSFLSHTTLHKWKFHSPR